jgi:hypothetical protein
LGKRFGPLAGLSRRKERAIVNVAGGRRGGLKEILMKRSLLIGAAALAIVLSGQALAQSVSVEIAPEQRTRIKEYVVKEKVPRATVKERYSVGANVPAEVELREVPGDWDPSVRSYRYYHTDNGIHFVDPANRRVIYDID